MTLQSDTEAKQASYIRGKIQEGQFRCFFCRKMFFVGYLAVGSKVEAKCPRCGEINIFKAI